MIKKRKNSFLEVGDVIEVNCALGDTRYYKVNSISGNMCFTKFRTFQRMVFCGCDVYEYGKSGNHLR